MIFQTTRKYSIACVRLILGKVWDDGFTGPQRETDARYEFGFKLILKNLGCIYISFQPFLIEFPSNK